MRLQAKHHIQITEQVYDVLVFGGVALADSSTVVEAEEMRRSRS